MTTETSLPGEEQTALMTYALNNLGRLLCEIRLLTSSGRGPIPPQTQLHLNQLAEALHNIPQIVVSGLLENDKSAFFEQWAKSELQRSIDACRVSAEQHAIFEDVLYAQTPEQTITPVELQS